MAKATVTVCDECQRVGVPTRTYAITRDSTKVTVDLCADHGEEIELLIEKALASGRQSSPTPPRKTPPRTAAVSRPTKLKVTSLEDIEAMKAKKK